MNLEYFKAIIDQSGGYYFIIDKSERIIHNSENIFDLFENGDLPRKNKNIAKCKLPKNLIENYKRLTSIEIFHANKVWIKWNIKKVNEDYLFTGTNITNDKRIEDKFYRQIELNSSILIFARNFISLPISQLNDHILISLKIVGEQINADSAYIILNEEDSDFFWSNKKIENNKYGLLKESSEFISKNKEIQNSDSFYLKKSEFPELTSNTKLFLPMIYNGVTFGFVIFDSFKDDSGWEEDIVNHLKLYTTILISALKRYKTESEIKKAFEKEVELNEIKSRFISTATHEFRTPLTAVLSSTEVLEMLLENPNKEISERHIDNVKESVHFLNDLIDDVLTVTKVDAGKLVFYPERFNFKKLCDTLYQEFFLAGENVKIFDYKYSCGAEFYKLDKKLIRNIVGNLLSNALKYAGKDCIINFWIEEINAKIIITIIDNGIGIPEKDQERLFEPFFRAGNIENIQGHGLGLSIVKKAVEMHNGEITFESNENKGTKFIVKIPVE